MRVVGQPCAGGTGNDAAGSGGAGVGQNPPQRDGRDGGGPNGGPYGTPRGAPGSFGGGGGSGFDVGSVGGGGGFGGGGGGAQDDGGSGGFGASFDGFGGFGGGGEASPRASGAGAGMGGAVFNDAGTVSISNTTLVGNAAHGGNIIASGRCSNCGNGSGYGGGNSSRGAGNLIQRESGFDGSVVSGDDPQLGNLPTTLTGGLADVLLPNFGSPVIDAATCDATAIDQRGVPRPQGMQCDIGAIEFDGVTAIAMSGSGQQTDVWTGFFNPLVVQVHNSAGLVVQNVPLHTTPAVVGQPGAICSTGISDDAGLATIYCRANGSVGGPYAVTVSAAGGPTTTSAVFLLTNLPGDGDLIFRDGFDPPGPRTSITRAQSAC